MLGHWGLSTLYQLEREVMKGHLADDGLEVNSSLTTGLLKVHSSPSPVIFPGTWQSPAMAVVARAV